MRLIRVILVFSWILSSSWTCVAQLNYEKSDFENIINTYKKYPNYVLEIDYLMYLDSDSDSLIDVQNCIIKQKGESRVFQISAIETISTKENILLIDHEEKMMTLNYQKEENETVNVGWDFENTLAGCHKIEPVFLEGNIKGYQMFIELPEVERVDIYFYRDTYQLHKIVLLYRGDIVNTEIEGMGKPRMEMIYQEFNTNPQFGSDALFVDKYLIKEGEKYILREKYKDYEFFNHIGYK